MRSNTSYLLLFLGKIRAESGSCKIRQSLAIKSDDNDCANCTELTEESMRNKHQRKTGCRSLLLLAAGVISAGTGCQVDVGGQTLPSGYYLSDDVQYYAPGPEFKLAKEAAAQKAYSEEQKRQIREAKAARPNRQASLPENFPRQQ
jgi:hypothetical protein